MLVAGALFALQFITSHGSFAVEPSPVVKPRVLLAPNRKPLEIAPMLLVFNKYLFFRDANINYVQVVNECFDRYRYTPGENRKWLAGSPLADACRTHYDKFDQILKDDLADLRVYRALSLIWIGRAAQALRNGQVQENFFSPEILGSMLPLRPNHLGLRLLLSTTQVDLPEQANFTGPERKRIRAILNYQTKNTCLSLLEQRQSILKEIKLPESLQKGKLEKILCSLDTLETPDFRPLNKEIDDSGLRILNGLRREMAERMLRETLPRLVENASKIYVTTVEKHPFLLLIQSPETFAEELPRAFIKLWEAQTAQLQEQDEDEYKIRNLERRMVRAPDYSNAADASAAESELHLILQKYLDIEYLVENQVLDHQMMKKLPEQAQALTELAQHRKDAVARGHLLEMGAIFGTAALCAAPQTRAFTLLLRNLCLFALNQPLTVYYAIHTGESLNQLYTRFLGDATGRGRFVTFKELRSEVGAYALSVSFLPIGSTMTYKLLRGKIEGP